MELDKIIQMLKGKTEPQLVRFVSDKGPNSCKACLEHHGRIFKQNDPNKPQLPIHPNCRCKYEELTTDKVAELQQNVQTAQAELIKLGNPIAESATRLLAEIENEFRNIAVSSTVAGTLHVISYADKINKVQKELESKVETTVETNQLKAKFTALQITLAAMQKINQTAEIVQSTMRNAGVTGFIRELISWRNLEHELTNALKNLHYNRLALREQQLHVLPKSPEEAEKQGFVKAPDSKNIYHRHKGQMGNVKYYNSSTKQEIIFDENGKVVTDIANIGTYNYFAPDGLEGIWHILVDVLPYYQWGNDKNDPIPTEDRILGPEGGKWLRNHPVPENFFENLSKDLDEILKRL